MPGIDPGASNLGSLAHQPIVLQYLFFCKGHLSSPLIQSMLSLSVFPQLTRFNGTVVLCASSTLAFHSSIRFLTSSQFSPLSATNILPRYPRPNSVSTALLVSSSTKLFPILMVIWEYDVPAAARSLGWAVVANNVEALRILLDCKYYKACLLAILGAAARWAVGRIILTLAGLGEVDAISENSVAADGKALWALVMYVTQWAGRLAVG